MTTAHGTTKADHAKANRIYWASFRQARADGRSISEAHGDAWTNAMDTATENGWKVDGWTMSDPEAHAAEWERKARANGIKVEG